MGEKQSKQGLSIIKEQHCVPGIVVGVTVNGESVYKKGLRMKKINFCPYSGILFEIRFGFKGFGYSDIENNVKASGNTVMRIASISKPISSAIAAKLLESNLVKLDEPIYTHLKTLPIFKWNGEEVCVLTLEKNNHENTKRFLISMIFIFDQRLTLR
jgi:serine beta-lactamase-like protein LACTB